MRYYKGNCLDREVIEEFVIKEKNQAHRFRFWRYLWFPFVLVGWIFQLVIHKSMEEE